MAQNDFFAKAVEDRLKGLFGDLLGKKAGEVEAAFGEEKVRPAEVGLRLL
jgi:hypothetical protein